MKCGLNRIDFYSQGEMVEGMSTHVESFDERVSTPRLSLSRPIFEQLEYVNNGSITSISTREMDVTVFIIKSRT